MNKDEETLYNEIFDFINEVQKRGHNLYLGMTTTPDFDNIGVLTNLDEVEIKVVGCLLANMGIRYEWFKKGMIMAIGLIGMEERNTQPKG